MFRSLLPRPAHFIGLLAAAITAIVILALPAPSAMAANVGIAPPLVEHCNDAAGAGLEVQCRVVVVNYLNVDGTQAASPPSPASTVTITTCFGPAGAPICAAPIVTNLLAPVSTIRQCNATLAGGGRVVCSATITNHFVVAPGAVLPATVFQCDGSFGGGGIVPGSTCLPVNTPGIIAMGTATVDQCDGSGNGGGAAFTCSVGASTITAAFPMQIDQCNGSNAGAGTTTICTAQTINDVVAIPAPPPPPDEDSGTASATPVPTPVPTVVAVAAATPSPVPTVLPLVVGTPVPVVPTPVPQQAPTPTPTPTPSPTVAPTPTPPPVVTATPVIPRPAPTGSGGLAEAPGSGVRTVLLLLIGGAVLALTARTLVMRSAR